MDSRRIDVNLRGNQDARDLFQERNRKVLNLDRRDIPSKSLEKDEDGKGFFPKIMDKVIGFSIFMLFFGMPIYFTGLTLQGIIFEKQMYFYFWLLLGLVAWIIKGAILGEIKIRRTPLDFPILGFWLASILATFFSVDYWRSLWGSFSDPSHGIISLTACIVAYYFIFSNFNVKRLKLFLMAIVFSGMILILWTSLVVLDLVPLSEKIMKYIPLSLAGSFTDLGVILSLLVPIFLVTILKVAETDPNLSKNEKNYRNFILGILLFFFLLSLFLILALYNYISWAILLVGLSIFLIFILAKIIRPAFGWAWFPLVAFVLVFIIWMTGNFSGSISRANLPVEIRMNYQMSKEIAIESIKNRFLLGSGPANFSYNFSLYRPQEFNLNTLSNLRFFQGTGFFAESISTVGVVGVFFLAILILSYVGSQIYLLAKDKSRNKLYSLGLFSATFILIANILMVKASGTLLVLCAFLVSLSLAVTLFESEAEENNLNFSLKSSPKFALALAFTFIMVSVGVAYLFIYLGRVYVADVYAGKAIASISENPQESLSYMDKAISLNNKESKYYIQTSQYYMSLVNQEAMKDENSRDINIIQKYLNNSITAAVQARNMSKNNIENVEALALIYENASFYVLDTLTLAEETYKRAQELEPHNPVYYLKLGQIKISLAQNENDPERRKQLISEAKEFFKNAIEKKNNYAEGYHQLSLVEEALGEMDQAIENASIAVQIENNNSNYHISLARMYQGRGGASDVKFAERSYKNAINLNDRNVNAHFYLGIFYEKNENKNEAKKHYEKVVSILEEGPKNEKNNETIEKVKKMISNIGRGIQNRPETLGLVEKNIEEQNDFQPEGLEDFQGPVDSLQGSVEDTENFEIEEEAIE